MKTERERERERRFGEQVQGLRVESLIINCPALGLLAVRLLVQGLGRGGEVCWRRVSVVGVNLLVLVYQSS